MKEDFEEFRQKAEKAYTKIWGTRCIVKDTDDYPELRYEPKSSRCPSCYAYELLDKHLDELWGDTQKWFVMERNETQAV